jgi:elongation factor P
MSSLTEIKKGSVIKYNNDPYVVVEARFSRMQQRKPVMQTKMRNLKTAQVMEYSFKQGEKIEFADVSRKKVAYLYKDKDQLYFMDQSSYEQFGVNANLIGDAVKFLKDSQEVDLIFFEDNLIGVELPPKVNLKVTQAPPGVKGDTATGAFKQITLETSAIISAPLFISEGEIVRVNTETGEYVERVSQ